MKLFVKKSQPTHPGDLPWDPVPPGGDLDNPGITDAEAGNPHGSPFEYQETRPGGEVAVPQGEPITTGGPLLRKGPV